MRIVSKKGFWYTLVLLESRTPKMFLVVVCLLSGILSVGSKETNGHMYPEFNQATVFRPKLTCLRTKRSIGETRFRGGHIDSLGVEIPVAGRNFSLDLRLNSELIGNRYKELYQVKGKTVERKWDIRTDHCHYQGHIRGVPGSWAAISTCNGLSGVISDGKDVHYVEKVQNSTSNASDGEHVLLSHSDIKPTDFKCGYEDTPSEFSGHRPRRHPVPSIMEHNVHARNPSSGRIGSVVPLLTKCRPWSGFRVVNWFCFHVKKVRRWDSIVDEPGCMH
ncbi:unnamed protein product [Notodromas monacha]|uniref:Peptidase M12B propeptide domain-containing protein n=1 Tax=Notodromas monacha TaxID=399045 RepID=A0A7R9GHG7_9CRUS|nr:unnamed protein product [Notodromas monacha]CAG0922778.1 unnamed protein product [Notodromas monacha]